MKISICTGFPAAAIGVVAMVVAGWLAFTVAQDPAVGRAGERAAAIAGKIAAVSGGQRFASDLAGAASQPGGMPDGMHRVIHDTVAGTLAALEGVRSLAAGQAYENAVGRLGDEVHRWRDEVERAMHTSPPQAALDAVAGQSRIISQMAEMVMKEVSADRVAHERAARQGAIAAALTAAAIIGAGALAFGTAGMAFGRRLAHEMALLPAGLRALAKDGAGAALPGQSRRDEFGTMVRELHGLAATMREMDRSRAEMERMALTDPLTGLPNRRGLCEFLSNRDGLSGDRASVAVMHIDLDHFKTINDANGHEAGDLVLREATRRMAMVIRDSDILARLGGDEFVIVAQGVTSVASLESLAARVIRAIEAPIAHGGKSFHVTASVGAVLGGRRGHVLDPRRLLINADVALCHAKTAGRNRCSVFTSAMARDVRRQQERGAEIRAAIARREFQVWFRPVLDLRARRAIALDLVTRWNHPERGVLPAGAFIDIAEAHSLTGSLAIPAFERAFEQIGRWRADGLQVPELHIGISRSVMLSASVIETLRWMFDDNHLDPSRIVFAFSERYCNGRGTEATFANLRRLADLGSGIIVDDFGSVDGALGNITRLGADRIKLNVARTGGLIASDRQASSHVAGILPAVSRIGESLGVRVLAKRVDTVEQRECLLARGFSGMQGDAVAPAMDADAVGEWLARPMATPLRAVAG